MGQIISQLGFDVSTMFCRHCELQFRHTGNTNLPGRDSWSGACQKTSHGTMPRSNMNKSSSGPSSINLMSGKKKKKKREAQVASRWRSPVLHPSMSRRMSKNPVHRWNYGSRPAIPTTVQVSLTAPAAVAGLSQRTWCSAKSRWMTVSKNNEDAGSGPAQVASHGTYAINWILFRLHHSLFP